MDIDHLSHESCSVLRSKYDNETRAVSSAIRNELLVAVTENVRVDRLAAGDDVVHVVGEDVGHPLQGQLRRLHSWVWVTGVGRGLQIEVEFLDDERASIPTFSKDPSGVLPCLMLFCFA